MLIMKSNTADSSLLVGRPCPVCGHSEAAERFRKKSLRIVQCGRCPMIFANPIEKGWADGSYYDQLSGPFFLSQNKLDGDYAKPRFARELRLFRKFCPRGTVIDVGCSTGAFLYQLNVSFPSDYSAIGLDIAGPALDHAESKGARVLRESYPEATSLADNSAQAVTLWAVMEHLDDPRRFLAKTARVLAQGGYCFILVPNFRSLAVRLLGPKYRYIFPQHVNYFTRETLRHFVSTEPSLRVVYETSMHFNPIVIAQDWRRGGEFVSDQERAQLLKRTTSYKQSPILAPVKLALAGVEAALSLLYLADNSVIVLQKTSR